MQMVKDNQATAFSFGKLKYFLSSTIILSYMTRNFTILNKSIQLTNDFITSNDDYFGCSITDTSPPAYSLIGKQCLAIIGSNELHYVIIY